MSPQLFERCIRLIKKKYEVRLLEDVLRDGEIPSHSVASVTFDDGFKDNLQHAAPLLEKYQCPASFYVVTDCVDTGRLPWSHRLARAFALTKALHLDFHSPLPSVENYRASLCTPQARKASADAFFSQLKHLTSDEVELVLDQLDSRLAPTKVTGDWMMDWSDLCELKKRGHYIGSHTCSHLHLASVKNEEEIERQLVESREKLGKRFGEPPRTVAYPWGGVSEQVRRLSSSSGYRYGLAVGQAFARPDDNDYSIPRMDLYPDCGWLKTRLRIMGLRKFWKSK